MTEKGSSSTSPNKFHFFCAVFVLHIRRQRSGGGKKNDSQMNLLWYKFLLIPLSCKWPSDFFVSSLLSDKAKNTNNCWQWKKKMNEWIALKRWSSASNERTKSTRMMRTVDHRKSCPYDKTDKGSNEVERLICIQLFHYIDILCQRLAVHCYIHYVAPHNNKKKWKRERIEQRIVGFLLFTNTHFFFVKCSDLHWQSVRQSFDHYFSLI